MAPDVRWTRSHVVAEAFISSRLLLFAVSAVVALRMRISPIDIWRQWDGWWYIGIAQRGYSWGFHGHSALAFFPLLPLLLHGLGRAGIPVTVGGLVLSNAAFFGALLYLHALVEPISGPRAARRVMWLLAFFPTAFFTFAPYTEALFLLAATGSFYHARRNEAYLAGLWVAVAVATRSTGIILFIPVLLLLGNRRWENIRAQRDSRFNRVDEGDTRRMWTFVIWKFRGPLAWVIAPSVAAGLLYIAYLHAHGIEPIAVINAQRSWHRSLTWPWTGFINSVAWPFHHRHSLWPSFVETIISLAVVVAILRLNQYAWSWMAWPERSYCLGFWFLVLCTPEWRDGYFAPFSSVDRFALVLFPLVWWAGTQISERQWRHVVIAEGVAMVACAGAFLAGTWIG